MVLCVCLYGWPCVGVKFGCDVECFGEYVFGLLDGGFGFGHEGLYCS